MEQVLTIILILIYGAGIAAWFHHLGYQKREDKFQNGGITWESDGKIVLGVNKIAGKVIVRVLDKSIVEIIKR